MLKGLSNWALNIASRSYKSILAQRLKNYGLQYEDLLIERQDVLKAIARSDPTSRLERERRLKRAFDVSAKKKTIPQEYHDYNPFELKLEPKIQTAEFERTERQLLNS